MGSRVEGDPVLAEGRCPRGDQAEPEEDRCRSSDDPWGRQVRRQV